MPRPFKKQLRFFMRSFWGTLLLIVVAVAACVQLGRAVFPVLDDYRPLLNQYASERLGANVVIGQIDARWRGLRPQVTLLDIAMTNDQNEAVATVERVEVQISLLAALYDWRVAFRRLRFHGLESNFVQTKEGLWRIRGLPPTTAGGGDFVVDDPLDIFLFGRRVELLNTAFDLEFRSGVQAQIRVPEISLENDEYFHRLAAAFWLDGKQAMRLVVEGHGDPRNSRTFDAAGYLQLNDFPVGSVLAALEGLEPMAFYDQLDGESKKNWLGDAELDLQLWFTGTSRKGVELKGLWRSDGFPPEAQASGQWPRQVSSEFAGAWLPRTGWRLALKDLKADWESFSSPPINAELRGTYARPLRLGFAEIDLGRWSELLTRSGWLSGRVQAWQQRLQPAGVLSQGELTFTGREDGYFRLRSHVKDGSIQSWRGVPSVEGVGGFVDLSAFAGYLALQNGSAVSLGLSQLYDEPLRFSDAHGTLGWSIDRDDKVAEIASSPMRVQVDDTDAQGQLYLRLPFDFSQGVGPELSLLLEADQCQARECLRYLPNKVPPGLASWLDEAVQEGQVRALRFLYHGPLRPKSPSERVLELGLQFEDAHLAFHKEWPALKDAEGQLLLEGRELTISGGRGSMGGLAIDNAVVKLPPKTGEGDERALLIEADARGISQDVLRLIAESPLSAPLSELESWQMTGPVTGRLELQIPMPGSSLKGQQALELALSDNHLVLSDLGLTLTALNGSFRYSSITGLHSDGLSAELWGSPIAASIDTSGVDDKTIKVNLQGRSHTDDIQAWLGRPELELVNGVADISGELLFPLGSHAPLQVNLFSDLTDVSIELPPPFAKERGRPMPLSVNMTRQRKENGNEPHVDFRLTLAELAEVIVRRQKGSIRGISIGVNAPAVVPESPVVALRGRLDQVKLEDWKPVWETYRAPDTLAATAGEAAAPLKQLPVQVNLAVGEVVLGDFSINNLHLSGGEEADGWLLNAVSEHSAGQVRVYNNRPLALDFSRLRLPGGSGENTSGELAGGLADMNLDWLPPLDFNVDQLHMGEKDFGSWSFQLRPLQEGLAVSDLQGSIRGLEITGKGELGAEILWLKSPLGQQTYVSGTVKARDLGDVFRAWGLDRPLTSDQARFDLEAQWPGAPDQLDAAALSGVVSMDIRRGRFIRGASVGENPLLKLIGLLNFDTLARRLRLDFSDLRSEGMGYERVQGGLQFREGTVMIEPSIKVETPSADLQFAGEVDINEQQVDARMVATLPVAGNLTVAAALTGGVPLAVGVYIIGKLFKSQVERVSSLRYRIQGDWTEPSVKLDKIFEDETD